VALQPLSVVSKTTKRDNSILVHDQVALMQAVQRQLPNVDMLLASGDYAGVLQLILAIEDVIADELAGIHVYTEIGARLNQLSQQVDQHVINDLVQHLVGPMLPSLNADAILQQEAGKIDEESVQQHQQQQPNAPHNPSLKKRPTASGVDLLPKRPFRKTTIHSFFFFSPLFTPKWQSWRTPSPRVNSSSRCCSRATR